MEQRWSFYIIALCCFCENNLGQFRPAVLAVPPHSFLCPCSLVELGELKSPWLRVSTTKQQPKDQCVVNVFLLLANEKKWTLSQLKPRHYPPFIPYHRTPCSEYKLWPLGWEGLIAAWGQAQHWVVAGEEFYCASLLSFGLYSSFSLLFNTTLNIISIYYCHYFILFQLLNCSYPNTWALFFISNSPHHWGQEVDGGFEWVGVEWVAAWFLVATLLTPCGCPGNYIQTSNS